MPTTKDGKMLISVTKVNNKKYPKNNSIFQPMIYNNDGDGDDKIQFVKSIFNGKNKIILKVKKSDNTYFRQEYTLNGAKDAINKVLKKCAFKFWR